ncbi:TPA: 3'-5' exoribonuclease [Escherichia coli]
MSKVFICAAIPDEQAIKEEGAVTVATAIEAGDERRARAKFHWQFLEHYPAAQDCAYKFLVCEDKPGIPRPALDSWDAEYMQENRWDEASASFVPVETESDPMNVTFDNLAPEVQNAVMVKFDTCENITVDMVISAQELLQEDMATFDGHIVEALMKMPEVNAMYPELKLHAIGWVKHKCKPGAKWPEIQAEMRIWKKRREGERKEAGKYTSVVDLARARANQQHTENSTGKINPVIAAIHREYKQTWKTLDDELAYALWPGDVDAGNIDGSIHRWAKNEVIDNDREDWKRISASMRKQPDALRYDRQTIFGLVRERPIDIHKDPVALNKYITEYLTTKGVFEDEGTNQSATDTLSSPVPETDAVETAIPDNEKTECKVEVEPSVEREGPFYFLFTDKDGEKYGRANKLSGLDKALSAGAAIMTDEIPLDDALLQLREFIDENSGEFFVHVWGNGANFDNTILRRSYERQGIPCPWRYYNDRDVRTIVELGKAIDFDARTAIPFEGERHNALDDARYQAKYVSAKRVCPNHAP